MHPKFRVYAYLATVGLFAVAMTGSGAVDLFRSPALMAAIAHLGYPPYLATLLGAWKLLGVAAIVAPGTPRLKEWAYAGFTFDLSGASISHLVSGDALSHVMVPLLLLALGLTSFALRPASRKLAA
jgi:hypothetical protein